MNIIIKQEQFKDYKITENVVKCAFANAEHSDKNEHNLVCRIRNSNVFIPELSLVAMDNERIVGHILFSKVKIKNEDQVVESLALAPVSVLPEYENQGVGVYCIIKVQSFATIKCGVQHKI